jgi:hypothetical protein
MSRDDPPEASALAPADVFALVGDETRTKILGALWSTPDETVSFSDLRVAAGVDDSGQFNYHLGRLVGHFVERAEEGYRLTPAGRSVLGAAVSGTYAAPSDPISLPVGDGCLDCGATLSATYDGGVMTVACPNCPRMRIAGSVPQGVFEGYDRADYPDVFDRWVRARLAQSRHGFCFNCGGPVSPAVRVDSETAATWSEDRVVVDYACERCPSDVSVSLASALLDDPGLVAFYHAHGVDVRETPVWRLDAFVHDLADVVSEDPFRARVTVEVDGDRFEATVDDRLTVVERRSPVTSRVD